VTGVQTCALPIFPLRNIDSVEVDEKGQVKLVIARALTPKEAEDLADKMNDLVFI